MSAFHEIKTVYKDVIAMMNKEFNSHEFILKLAQAHQSRYIRCLYEHVNSPHPFKVTHGHLAQMLDDFGELIEKIDSKNSPNIFGESSDASVYRKR